jgi:putative endonuclease
MDYFDYILRSVKTSSYYIGHTNNITDRFDRHNEGRVLSTKSDRPWELVVYYRYKSRAEAMKLEKRLKAFKNRRALETYIKKNL